MAVATEVKFVDDISGAKNAKTYSFAVDGQSYEIDLTDANKRALDKALSRFVNAARKTPPRGTAIQGNRYAGGRADVRQWARDNGYTVSDKGRLSFQILEAWQNSQNDAGAAAVIDSFNPADIEVHC